MVDQSCDLSRNCARPLTTASISKHNFEIPVHNYVVKNEHIVLLMIMKLLMPLCNRIESTNSKAIS